MGRPTRKWQDIIKMRARDCGATSFILRVGASDMLLQTLQWIFISRNLWTSTMQIQQCRYYTVIIFIKIISAYLSFRILE